jgi:tripartite-type tricarboxylate transporter receptor subunit TctC
MKQKLFSKATGMKALGFTAALLMAGMTQLAQAQAYPNKPVKMLIPFPPGGPTDLTGRTYADKLTTALGQSFVVENRPGPNGIIVSNATIAAAADGYTLAFSSVGGAVLAPAINAYRNKPQDPDTLKQLTSVSLMAETPLGIFVNPALNINTVAELIAQMRANPGKLNNASDGIGSSTHLAEELFLNLLKLESAHVPFKGTVDVMNALMQGQVQWSFSGIGGPPLPLHRQGRVKIIAVGGSARLPALPEIPTVAEAANLPGFDVASWFAIFVRTGTDKAIINTLSTEIQKAAKMQDVIDKLGALSIVAKGSTPEQLTAKVDADYKKWSDLLKTGKIKFD